MYIVNSVKQLKNKKYTIIIKNNDKLESYEVSEDILVEFRLLKDKELSKTDYDKFRKANDKDLVYQKVLHYALYKMRSEKEIIDYLEKNKIPFSQQNYYLNKLKKAKIVDDIMYSEIFVRESFYFKKNGPNKIIHELDLKKINRNYYSNQLESIKDNEIKANIEYWFNKKLHTIKNKSIKQAISIIKQFIVNKGYSFEMVNNYINKNSYRLEEVIDETEVLVKDYLKAKKKYTAKPDAKKSIIASLLRKGYNYSKIKIVMGDD